MPEFTPIELTNKGVGLGQDVQATAEHLAKLKGENPAQPSVSTIEQATRIVVGNRNSPKSPAAK